MSFTRVWNSVLFIMLIFTPVVRAEDRILIADFASSVGAPGVPAGWELKEKWQTELLTRFGQWQGMISLD